VRNGDQLNKYRNGAALKEILVHKFNGLQNYAESKLSLSAFFKASLA
jgi:hypothetical protein